MFSIALECYGYLIELTYAGPLLGAERTGPGVV